MNTKTDQPPLDRRNIRVNGKNYVLHVAAGDKTLCGRMVRRVNCFGNDYDVRSYIGDLEVSCRVCAAKYSSMQTNSVE